MQAQEQYIPGVCNIGRSEINRRRQLGWSGLIATVILYIVFVFLRVPHLFRLSLFIPAMLSATDFLQARIHFCAYFGMMGVYNLSEELGKIEAIERDKFKAMDRRKAWRIIVQSAIIGAAVAALAYYLPL